jgi:hypothetical protein
VIHVVYQSIGVAVILTGTLTRNLNWSTNIVAIS